MYRGVVSWNDVPGKYSVEISINENGIWDTHNDVELKMLPSYVVDGDEMIIHFTCNGYYQPDSMYGGPHNLGYPADGGEERFLSHIEINGKRLPRDVANEIFELYESQIENVEVNYDVERNYEEE